MLTTNDLYVIALVAATTVGVIVIASSSLERVNAQSTGSFQNMTSTLLKYAREHFSRAVEALDNNNVTGAVSEARSGTFFLDMLHVPTYCVPKNNEKLECGFVTTNNGMLQDGFRVSFQLYEKSSRGTSVTSDTHFNYNLK
jgi:hypothetical protein